VINERMYMMIVEKIFGGQQKNIGVYTLKKDIRESDLIYVICWWFDRKEVWR